MRATRLDMIPYRRFVLLSTFAAALVAVSCAKAPPPPPPPPEAPLTITAAADARVKAPMTIAATADINPDSTGRPSPVVVRVYQLRTDAAFAKADFFALFDDEQKVLGQELISRDEFMLAPTERRTLDVTVAGDTRFVGAIAAFRDIRNAQWRGIVPAPRTGLTVSVERARVVLTPAAN
jgi:type VI secretion system protein VasD